MLDMYNPVHAVIAAFHTMCDGYWGVPMELPESIKDRQIALLSSFSVDMENFGYDKDSVCHEEWHVRECMKFHCLVTRDRRAFLATVNEDLLPLIPTVSFVNVSNHDSCWKDTLESEIHKYVQGMHERCESKTPEEFRHPTLVNVFCHFDTFKLFQFVKIELERCHHDDYYSKIVKIEPLKMTSLKLDSMTEGDSTNVK